MLTKELAIFQCEGDQLKPDRLDQYKHRHYVAFAEEMLRVYSKGIGKKRHELHSAIRKIFADEPDCPLRRIDSFCKLLDEDGVSYFDRDQYGKAALLRCKVFRLAARYHPLVEHKDRLFENCAAETKQTISRELGRECWNDVEGELFADVFEYNRLKSFTGYRSPDALLSRYNVAQLQAALFNATRLTIWTRSDFQRIVTHIKLAHLLHDITPPADGSPDGEYAMVLDGPASVLRETRRYGVNMARFLPALLSCRNWRMRAEIPHQFTRHSRRFRLELSSKSGFKSDIPPQEDYDSSVEEGFAKKWGQERRNGWLMKREGTLLQCKQTIFIPDFAFQHENGTKVFLEIIGFWTPEYLEAKAEKLRLFKDHHIIQAVAEQQANKWQESSKNVFFYKTALKLADVLAALDRIQSS